MHNNIANLVNKIICGDCKDVMAQFPDDCIDLTITSPPYDNLRTYCGYTFNFEGIAKQLYRITKIGGVVVWVVGDATIKGSETGTSFKQALYFKELGFNLHDTMIWTKDGGGAIGSNKSYTQNFEYMFVFSKGEIKTFNLIKDKPNLSFGVDKSGIGRRRITGEHKIEQRKESVKFSRRNNFWYIAPERGEHPAVFPEKLAGDHIISWSNSLDIILDPLCGSGTTPVMAKKLSRKYIAIDSNPEYVKMAEDRLRNTERSLF